MSIRPASARLWSAADADTVAALRAEARAEIAPLRGGGLYDPAELPAGGDADRPLWVGELEGAVVGYLFGSTSGSLGRIDGVFVHPDCRAVGVGEVLMATSLDWFRSRQCVGVDGLALPGARATKNFFEETGFTARLLVMHHPL